MSDYRKQDLLKSLKTALAALAGKDLSEVDPRATFFELGFDSLLLTQAAAVLKNRFRVKITFRQLLEDLTTFESIVSYLDQQMPPDSAPAPASPAPPAVESKPAPGPVTAPAANAISAAGLSGNSVLERVMKEQLAVMARQLEMLRGAPASSPSSDIRVPALRQPKTEPKETKAFGPYRPIQTAAVCDFTEQQNRALGELIRRYTGKTLQSKRQTQHDRRQFCDPRSVAGFRTFWKEMVYPIITVRSEGARFWDVDGNEYIDVTMGFGTNLLGHNPPFVTKAIEEQLRRGIEVGPQSPLAGQAARLLCELTGHERAAFCNTGSEAVLAAIRIARTVTGRTRIATTGGFHGICDEVLVRANVVNGQRVTVPVAPGIPDHVAREVLVVDYGTEEGLRILEKNMDDLALVLVEPVQSRHPDLQPRDFLHELRRLTAAHETPLLFDEVITGFRCNLRGAQAYFGLKADLATWGKVIGGGMPIGALTGSAKYMDALDGGFWQYGDASFPEVGVTFFAGTYVRHPLTMAASCAMLNYLVEQGPGLQERLTARTENFVVQLRAFVQARAVPLHVEQFASMFYMHFAPETRHGSLFWFYLRDKGIHFWEGRPGFLSTAHTDEDVAYLLQTIKETIVEMQEVGFLPPAPAHAPRLTVHLEFPLSRKSELSIPTAPSIVPSVEEVVTEAARGGVAESRPAEAATGRGIDFSVYFFGNYPAEYRADKYQIIVEAAKFADRHGFKAIWLPERHFHAVGGFSPNPSVVAAALARETQQLQLRGGSVVLPLHHPVRVAEEWAVVDNLSAGRAGISIASGWHPNDFVFAPHAFERRREICWEGYDIIQKLWRGEEVELPTGSEGRINVKLHPMPKQPRLPTWLTCIHKESYVKAGELGMGALGYTMNTTLDELAEKIRLYRESFSKHGHDPRHANVTILLHTFVGSTADSARAIARQPMREYLRAYLDNSQKRLETQFNGAAVAEEDVQYLLDKAFDDYVNGKALIGSPESCASVVAQMKKMGVDEIGCFLDFGIDPATVLAHLPQIAALQRLCHGEPDRPEQATAAEIRPAEEVGSEKVIDLPDAQQGLVAIAALGRDASRAYTEGNTLELRGPLDLPALRRALQRCVDRHQTLRTSLNPDSQAQTIHTHVTLDVPFLDLSDLAQAPQSERLRELFKELEAEPFNLHSAPLMKASVIKLAQERHWLLLFFHHSLGNGPAYWILFDDLCAFYESQTTGAPFSRSSPMQLSEYVAWRAARARSAEYAADENFWLRQFASHPPILDLPTDRPRPSAKSYLGGRAVLRLDKGLTGALRRMGATKQCSLYMVLLSGFKTLMHRLSGQDDLVVGTPFDSEVRSLPSGDVLFANTTNMTPLRSQISTETTFAELLAATRSQVIEAQEHQDYFFGNLLRKLGLRSDSGAPVLFSVGFNYESGKFHKKAGAVEIEYLTDDVPYRCPKDTAMFGLNLNVAEQDGALLCECDYDSDLFDKSSVERMLRQLQLLLEGAYSDPESPISRLNLLSEVEREKILVEWNQTDLEFDREKCLHQLIEQQAGRAPGEVAVVCEGREMTYGQLNERANALALRLQKVGVKPDSLVGICMDRSLEMAVGLLGILKAGGAYVPLDPKYPRERLAFMLNDALPTALVTQEKLRAILPASSSTLVSLDEMDLATAANGSGPDPIVRPHNLAYVLYTSGSTGQPKGVAIEHRGAVALAAWARQVFSDEELSGVLFATSICFDLSVFELFVTLACGGKVIIAENILQWPTLTSASQVKLVNAVPSAIEELAGIGGIPEGVVTVNLAGERLTAALVDKLYQHPTIGKVYDLYGPTECTTYSTFTLRSRGGRATIGRPIANTRAYILDRDGRPVPLGARGELYLGGDGLARGYLHRESMTRERFVPDPFSPQNAARLYKTGDLARYLPDGNIEYHGRIDHQVKIRGFRIELGEIESVLNEHPVVRECTVVVREDSPGKKRLVCFVTRKDSGPSLPATERGATIGDDQLSKEIKARAQLMLPGYMVPSVVSVLGELPRTPNGKLDRKALQALPMDASVESREFIAPRNEKEKALADIWMQVLGLDKISVLDNFFELGGDSLLSFRVSNRASRVGLRLTPQLFFQHRTIAAIVNAMEGQAGAGPAEFPAPVIGRVSRAAFKRKLPSIETS